MTSSGASILRKPPRANRTPDERRAWSRSRRQTIPSLALSHTLGGIPSHTVSAVAIVGFADA